MGFLDKFVTVTDDKKPAPAATNVQPIQLPTPVASAGDVEKFVQQLKSAIASVQMSGQGSSSFIKALDALANTPLPEDVKYQTALATYAALGGDVAQLEAGLDNELRVLSNEKIKFEGALQKASNDSVGNIQRTIDDLQRANEDATQLIANLTKKIQDNSSTLVQKRNELSQESQVIEVQKQSFNTAYETVRNIIINLQSKIKRVKK